MTDDQQPEPGGAQRTGPDGGDQESLTDRLVTGVFRGTHYAKLTRSLSVTQ